MKSSWILPLPFVAVAPYSSRIVFCFDNEDSIGAYHDMVNIAVGFGEMEVVYQVIIIAQLFQRIGYDFLAGSAR